MAREGLNRVTLIGNLGFDPELNFTKSGEAVLKMRLATSESFKGRDGSRQERTEWHTCVLWGKRGEALSKFLAKGRSLCVEGSIQYRQWEDKDGNKRTSTEIRAQNVVLLGGGDGARRDTKRDDFGGGDFNDAQDDFGDDEIPF